MINITTEKDILEIMDFIEKINNYIFLIDSVICGTNVRRLVVMHNYSY